MDTFVLINPGTHADPLATLENAEAIAGEICVDIGFNGSPIHIPDKDARGWFRFDFISGDRRVEVDIPGDDPDTVCKSQPFVSRRLYVDGSSWLYKFALGFIERGLGKDE